MFKNGLTITQTEKRLLEAAGAIFAEYGYRAATVRQICERAGANLAAVNYHFGDKEGLYMAVLRFVQKAYAEKYPSKPSLQPGATAEQRLRAYIRSLLYRIFERGRPGWHMKLMAREMVEPTRAFDTLVEEAVRPLHEELASIVRELLGPKASNRDVRLSTLSILSQGVYYHRALPVLGRLYPQSRYGSEEIEALVEHITQFSLSGLAGVSKEIKDESR
jgi:TetR/AcrR family transcriptional regulator, regulator of cefoperazone and chloramphenicol sensitivity